MGMNPFFMMSYANERRTTMKSSMNLMDQVLSEYSGTGCEASPKPFPAVTPEAIAFVPFQQFGATYPPEKGMDIGTIFPELDKPFLGGGAAK
jgi:hypothetical protein